MPKKLKTFPSIYSLYEEYGSDVLLDTEITHDIKLIIESLPPTDRALITVYADTGSLKETATLLHISVYKVWKEVNRIKEEIKTRLASKLI